MSKVTIAGYKITQLYKKTMKVNVKLTYNLQIRYIYLFKLNVLVNLTNHRFNYSYFFISNIFFYYVRF